MSRDLHIKVEAEPASVWFFAGVIGIFTLMCLLSFLQRMSYAGPDELFMLAVGLFGVWALWRLYRYYRVPNVSVTADALIWRPFWRPTVRLRYDEVESFASVSEDIETRFYVPGRPKGFETGEVLNVGKLGVVMNSGRTWTIVLPTYDPALRAEFFKTLKRRSGRPVGGL